MTDHQKTRLNIPKYEEVASSTSGSDRSASDEEFTSYEFETPLEDEGVCCDPDDEEITLGELLLASEDDEDDCDYDDAEEEPYEEEDPSELVTPEDSD